ncbi:MAG TPA: TetR/AcrR family transcriptional regulator [Acidimicrobiales bacterium]|nr:TetR/AcrR family transcriptional regulator [Acidimicrobiales bacterium]
MSNTQAKSLRAHPRRTQEERRAQMRAKLLDATIECVLETGYANTTTRRVAELAGVSQGAQTHHFPRRVDLVGAAVERLAERRLAELREMASDLPAEPRECLAALLDLIWADFSSPTFTVFVKLWVAAADDPELYARLVPVERQLARAIAALAAQLGGELIGPSQWEERLTLTLAAVRGLALSERFEPRGQRRRDPWPAVRALLLESFIPQPAGLR